MTLPSEKLAELGLELPEVAKPVAAYVPAIEDGAVGEDGADPEDAYEAARICALNAMAAAAAVAGGVDRLASVVKVTAFVASLPNFYGQAAVVNGASELLGEVFGSQHARSAVGVAALPLNASVEVEVEFALRSE